MAVAARGAFRSSILDPILCFVYVTDFADSLTIDHLLYADEVKIIAPRNQAAALQSSLATTSTWSEGWELIINPSKSEDLPAGDTTNPVTYVLTSCTSCNA